MTPCEIFFAIIIIIKCLATPSSAGCSGSRNIILPRGSVRVMYDHGQLIAGLAGIICPDEINHLCLETVVSELPNPSDYRTIERTYAAPVNHLITQKSDKGYQSSKGTHYE
ncbi:uncharacterized protein LOC117178074 isoform X2 [Belonocnema kinseyi]|uniref:uncharacterized protein LOC117178074 isoform X2 n=1 Tax=Belonocnema kinseyi TaxID=2817044 RepID=UPI00143D75FB|nr:uncharacterized protein LOC117178074 isoform X2 [Belonocnema kinseyi]